MRYSKLRAAIIGSTMAVKVRRGEKGAGMQQLKFCYYNKMAEKDMTEQLNAQLQVRYIKLHFHLHMLEDTWLPRNKVSALRGGMGEMLLRSNCIRDRECPDCDFAGECIVRRIMYSRMEIQPDFMHQGDSVGYVVECEDYREEYRAGDMLAFQLILFGKNIVYFHQYMQAFAYLGRKGLGKNRAHFSIESVTNSQCEKLVEGGQIYKNNFTVQTLAEYVKYRMRERRREDILLFHTPLTLKYQGRIMEGFQTEAVMAAIARRLYILACFEGIDAGKADISGHVPDLISQRVRKSAVARYSSTHDEKIWLKGIRGSARIRMPDETAKILLYAGELMHIGKNTSFGFGRYSLALEKRGIGIE